VGKGVAGLVLVAGRRRGVFRRPYSAGWQPPLGRQRVGRGREVRLGFPGRPRRRFHPGDSRGEPSDPHRTGDSERRGAQQALGRLRLGLQSERRLESAAQGATRAKAGRGPHLATGRYSFFYFFFFYRLQF
jgi:hypothetical protein